MSSYGSTSPSDEGFDRYEPPFYCPPSHQGSPMDGGMYWAGNSEGQEFDAQDMYHDTNNYISRSYGYDEMQIANNEPYDAYNNMIHINYGQNSTGLDCDMQIPRYDRPAPAFVRVVKRRTTANKKERRRTQSINTAFTDLRECIPNVPPDTKLSKMARRSQSINTAFSNLRDRIPSVLPDTKLTKIKTLRLATSYISYLLKVLETDGEPAGGFRAELQHTPPRRRTAESQQHIMAPMSNADRQKRFRERLKQNPIKYEEMRKKHLERVKLNKIKIKDQNQSQKEKSRQKWREYSARYYKRNQNKSTGELNTDR